ncbi:MAG: hypothetical protein ACRDNJ_13440 [Solirubrobacteraceae bacterium]
MPDQSSAADEHAILQEITRPLETLPDDPLAEVDAEFPTVLRGYDRLAVDDYVRDTRRLVAELQATRSPEAAVRRALERVGEQISGILQRAHETAGQIAAQSRVDAENRLEQSRAEAIEIRREAEQRVRDLDADTDRIWAERERIIADTEDLAGQLVALARSAAARFPADAETEVRRREELDEDETEAVDQGEAEPVDEDETEPVDQGEAEPVEPVDEDETEPVEPGGEGEAELAEDETERSLTDDEPDPTVAFRPLAKPGDDTAVIPPASQAASRRRPR